MIYDMIRYDISYDDTSAWTRANLTFYRAVR